MINILTFAILAIIILVIYFAFRPKKEDEEESQPKPKLVNEENVKAYFKYPDEIPTIYSVIEVYLETYKNTLAQYPLLVNPYAFMLAVRMCEQGRKGREFGVMAEGAIDTDLKTQAEWTIVTLIKDTIRWHRGKLAKGKKEDYPTFIFYFSDKWCPSEAHELNKNWLPNFQKFYGLFLP